MKAFPYYFQKGKMYKDLTATDISLIPSKVYVKSKKYDGHRIFITKVRREIRTFTSDWKEFSFPTCSGAKSILEQLKENKIDFILESEFNFGCEGKLGDRGKSAILTTFRTNFNKGLNYIDDTFEHKCNIKLFDLLTIKDGQLCTQIAYIDRLNLLANLSLPSFMEVIKYELVRGYAIPELTKQVVKDGWEGCMFVDKDSYYQLGKNSNKRTSCIIKNKARPTVDLLCIGTEEGIGKYTGLIGAVVLKDSLGRIVSVGSGLTDDQRNMPSEYFKGKVIEISYEQIQATYLQPVFITVREDKSQREID